MLTGLGWLLLTGFLLQKSAKQPQQTHEMVPLLLLHSHHLRVLSERLHESVGVPGWYLEPRGLHSGGVSLSPLSPGLTAEHDVRKWRRGLRRTGGHVDRSARALSLTLTD